MAAIGAAAAMTMKTMRGVVSAAARGVVLVLIVVGLLGGGGFEGGAEAFEQIDAESGGQAGIQVDGLA